MGKRGRLEQVTSKLDFRGKETRMSGGIDILPSRKRNSLTRGRFDIFLRFLCLSIGGESENWGNLSIFL